MKKYLPFVFPALSLLIVLFLVFRWYNQRTERGNITPFAEGIDITQLDDNAGMDLAKNDNSNSVPMTAQPQGDEAAMALNSGEIRFQADGDQITFAVYAQLPEGEYEVWLKDPNSESVRKAFALKLMKGGYVGSAAISQDALPFEVLVTPAGLETPDKVLLRGQLTAQDCSGDECMINIEELTE